MTTKILAIVFGVLLGISLIALIIWTSFYFSKSQKNIREKARKEAKKEKQQIIGSGYKEINQERRKINDEVEQTKIFIAKEMTNLEFEKQQLNSMKATLNNREINVENYENSLKKQEKELNILSEKLENDLANVASISKEEAKEKMFEVVKHNTAKELSAYVRSQELEASKTAKKKAADILLEAMEKFKTDFASERVTTVVKIPDEQMKGRIIGKDGRNIKTFEQYAGVDIVIDDTPDMILVSSFNPIRREIAVKTLEKLISDGRIQPVRIEQELIEQEKLLNDVILETGQKVTEELGIYDMDLQLVKLVGQLKYRTSYTQNVLTHSIEVAQISRTIAEELGLNAHDAVRAGLLHDIGKAVDFEEEGNHVELGVELARKYGENEVVVNAIAAHHEDVPKQTFIASIVAIADSISASRPGARNEQTEDFVKRINEIEEICNQIPGVTRSYALQSGRQVRVIVDPAVVSDYDISQLSQEIADKLKEVSIPGNTTLTIIRERRETTIIK
ncbi:ribonuclease Y [Mesoplasma lactucae]|uniref:Ribonuclease Y n=1 Tax=Mesoplasma lactucae ATCC 49193 TaxID=81460 RepID=A0A291IR93_9MOLU|nr:ribonuclease Y [Mesoplasma lactucae]ATG97309.1 ribonuclease Y [Mesoplasma lactucae ATCC 49193]ATZ20240.1 ribonuclease Y [Mesoplasma lactucae ATCC 49193]MCL8216989.1 Ribonuclease Y [Mesoplasma lactucae ATCC 49193]